MENKIVNCNGIEISNKNKICLIAGPCQLETEQHAMDMAGNIKEITEKLEDVTSQLSSVDYSQVKKLNATGNVSDQTVEEAKKTIYGRWNVTPSSSKSLSSKRFFKKKSTMPPTKVKARNLKIKVRGLIALSLMAFIAVAPAPFFLPSNFASLSALLCFFFLSCENQI